MNLIGDAPPGRKRVAMEAGDVRMVMRQRPIYESALGED
jgi:hypothetical protein